MTFLGRPVPPAFELRIVAVDPGGEHLYDAAEWAGAVVGVEAGEISLECVRGTRCAFARGSVLALSGLPLRALVNRGAEPAVLAAVYRA